MMGWLCYTTYLLDDGRDVAGVLLHGLGVLVVLEGRHGGAARSPAPRSHTLICRAALLCLKGAGLCFALVEAGRHPSSEPSVYHSRGSHAPQILVALRGSPSSLFPTREKAAHLPGERMEEELPVPRAKMEKELDEEAPQHEDDARRSAPFSPAALLSRGQPPNASRRAPTPTPVPASRAP